MNSTVKFLLANPFMEGPVTSIYQHTDNGITDDKQPADFGNYLVNILLQTKHM